MENKFNGTIITVFINIEDSNFKKNIYGTHTASMLVFVSKHCNDWQNLTDVQK